MWSRDGQLRLVAGIRVPSPQEAGGSSVGHECKWDPRGGTSRAPYAISGNILDLVSQCFLKHDMDCCNVVTPDVC